MTSRLACTCLRPSLPLVTPSSLTRSIHAPSSLPPLSRIPKPRGNYLLDLPIQLFPHSSQLLTLSPETLLAPFDSPSSVLSASSRGLEQYSDKFESWESLFSKTSNELRDTVGMNIRETRYLLRILEKYRSVPPAFFLLESSVMELMSMRRRESRQGFNPDQVAVKEKPKKVIRGWGPRVQNGIRVR